ncbi:hypothetical protein NB851_027340, partial [Pseudomonas aeruginosa]|nr:hypothetical protein [Pseudomonas aeruginosa]
MSAATATRSQLALQSYLDALLQEATFEDLEPLVETPPAPAPAPLKPVALAVAEVATPAPALETLPVDHGFDEFEAAVLEEQVRDARLVPPAPAALSRRPSGLRKTTVQSNSLAHRTTWLRSDLADHGSDESEAAVLEEQARDARLVPPAPAAL